MQKLILKYGIPTGLFMAVMAYLSIHGHIGMFTASSIMTVVPVIVSFFAAKEYKSANGGFASFGELLKLFAGFIGISILLSTIASVIINVSLDENQKQEIIDKMTQAAVDMYEKLGMPQEQIALAEEKLEEQYKSIFSVGTNVLNAVMTFLMIMFLSMIPAAIMKKNKD